MLVSVFEAQCFVERHRPDRKGLRHCWFRLTSLVSVERHRPDRKGLRLAFIDKCHTVKHVERHRPDRKGLRRLHHQHYSLIYHVERHRPDRKGLRPWNCSSLDNIVASKDIALIERD